MEPHINQRLEDDPPEPLPAQRKVSQGNKPYHWICPECGFESNNHIKCKFCEESVLVPL